MDSQEIPGEILVLQSSLELINVEAVMKISPSLKLIETCIRPQSDRFTSQVKLRVVSVAVGTSSHGMGSWRDGQTATMPCLQQLPDALQRDLVLLGRALVSQHWQKVGNCEHRQSNPQ